MQTRPNTALDIADLSTLSQSELVAVITRLQADVASRDAALEAHSKALEARSAALAASSGKLKQREAYIDVLDELLRLKHVQQFGASSEKLSHQIQLFDEAELEAEISALRDQLPEGLEDDADPAPAKRRQGRRGFSASLLRERIELTLSESEKAGASKTFFTKVKEELLLIPAQLKVLEYWQEKAVFERTDASDQIVAAKRPVHPLGKCIASPSLLAYIITSKYADGLPLYRQEQMLKRLGHEVSRTSMAHWIIQLDGVLQPLMNLMREVQNSGSYLQADETRIQVLKEDGKTAQSDKWMWLTRGGPPDKPSVLFAYDPSRAGTVPVRLLDDFEGILQADGYSGYGDVCRQNGLRRIGCWDHARRKFVEATKAASAGNTKSKSKVKTSKAHTALGYINKLYAVERQIKTLSEAERYGVRQSMSVPLLEAFKAWLDVNATKVMKGSLTRKAMDYTLNQWTYLIGYCERGDLHMSNVLAENAIRPFALGRKAWLFADTPQGARASATCFSLIETAKANGLEPSRYIHHVLKHIGEAATLEQLEALLPWNVSLESV